MPARVAIYRSTTPAVRLSNSLTSLGDSRGGDVWQNAQILEIVAGKKMFGNAAQRRN